MPARDPTVTQAPGLCACCGHSIGLFISPCLAKFKQPIPYCLASFAALPASQNLLMQLPPTLQGAKARELAAFVKSVTQEGAVVLPDAAQKAAAFHAIVHSLVYDVLMSKVSSRRVQLWPERWLASGAVQAVQQRGV